MKIKNKIIISKLDNGFTLIELLIVVAIIGLLSVVAYGYLDDARSDSRDAAVKADLKNMHPEMELLYVEAGSQSYEGLCDHPKINRYKVSIQSKIGNVLNCHDNQTNWAADVELLSSDFFCIDSQGRSTERALDKDTVTGNADSTSCL